MQPPVQPPVPISDEQPEIELSQTAGLLRTRSALVLSDPSTDGEATTAAGLDVVDEMAAMPESGDGDVSEVEMDEDIEDWEADLDEGVRGPESHIHDWANLRKEIKDQLKKKSKTLPLSQLNQLLIISNFATLRLKGVSRIQASLEIARQWHEGEGNWFA